MLRFTYAALLLIVASGISSPGFAATSDLTLELIDLRLQTLREDGGMHLDETLQAYEIARRRLHDAASFDLDTAKYVSALTRSSQREAEIQKRIDRLDESADMPADFASLSFDELESRLALAQAELLGAKASLDSHERRLASRQKQTKGIRLRLAEIANRLGEIDRPDLAIDPNGPPSIVEALQWSVAAEFISLISERRAKETELDSQPVRYSALQTERAATTLVIAVLDRRVRALEEGLRHNLSNDVDPIEFGIHLDDLVYPVANFLINDNRRLREQRLGVEAGLDTVSAQGTAVSKNIRAQGERFATARQMVDFAADSDVLGAVLLAYWEDIDIFRIADPTIEIPEQVGNSVINRIDHEEALGEIANLSGFVTSQLEKAGISPDLISNSSREALNILTRSRRDQLRRIIEVESDYIFALNELDVDYKKLTATIDEYEEYLSVLILWKPSRQRLWDLNLRKLPLEVNNAIFELQKAQAKLQPLSILLVSLAIVILFLRSHISNAQYKFNPLVRRPRHDSIRYTFIVLFLTFLRAMPPTLLILAIRELYMQDTASVEKDLATALSFIAGVLYVLFFKRILCEEQGVARVHFGWNPEVCDRWLIDTAWLGSIPKLL